MMEWGGWRYDEVGRRVTSPVNAVLSPMSGAMFGALAAARGLAVSRRGIAEAIARASASADPVNCVGVTAHKLNKLLALLGAGAGSVENVKGFGYRLMPARIAEDPAVVRRRGEVAALLADQFEATGPHARAAAIMIDSIYQQRGKL